MSYLVRGEPETDVMQAVVQDAYGAADVLHPATVEKPAIAANEVLVQVRAAGVDRGTWHLMTGRPYLMRILGFGFRRPKSRVPGLDVAGTVVEVGSEVTRFKAGDEVLGIGRGSFAEYAAAREDRLVHKPGRLGFPEAAVVPVSGLTALQAVRDLGQVEARQTVLVVGASGGVGTYAVQLARALGAEVTGVCSTAKLDLVRSIGADHVIDYSRDDFADGSRRYDLILDVGGSSPLSRLRRALAPRGTLVIVGGEEGGTWTGMGRQLRALALSPFLRQRLTVLLSRHRLADLEALRRLIEDGRVAPVLDRTYPLARAGDALRHLETGHARGKIAVTP
jgi:NADPH:quinone reductase-like Zn-dependent oxidoreductase